ncbi:bifunctional diaminohydroxyphosphoribosylaminopyrimidine deaminase/5-amino-6-(5-phosphoribosylamino)uracil reductase RibD [Granulosicoccaceae sp. 1_MG-2023]|nr:bifunctional diaminohydroxyphosphoribosylaminopyrimidine deaminase/5-amino-6-(5-phosphoribosylamino)uracil reductase RibD [Granulosicoccaceae sp. 1_MG-2023]
MNHEALMARAIRLARHGLYTTEPNPRVGCVLVKNGRIVGEGFHARAGQGHAEVQALADAGSDARGSTAYVTLEPCSHTGRTPPCADALIKAGVTQVVAAMTDPNPLVAGCGLARLRDAGITVLSGVLEAQARALNPGFIKRMQTGLPWVRIKLASSLDGRTAMASGESVWITGPAARADVQRLRARSGCVLTGSGTVRYDNPSLNVRLSAEELGIDGEVRQPLRAVIAGRGDIDPAAKLFSLPGPVRVYSRVPFRLSRACDSNVVSAGEGHLPLRPVLEDLAALGVNEVHVEAGAGLAGALVGAGLADEIVLYMACHLMGDEGLPLFRLPGLQAMHERLALELQEVRQIGVDLRLVLRPAAPGA